MSDFRRAAAVVVTVLAALLLRLRVRVREKVNRVAAHVEPTRPVHIASWQLLSY